MTFMLIAFAGYALLAVTVLTRRHRWMTGPTGAYLGAAVGGGLVLAAFLADAPLMLWWGGSVVMGNLIGSAWAETDTYQFGL